MMAQPDVLNRPLGADIRRGLTAVVAVAVVIVIVFLSLRHNQPSVSTRAGSASTVAATPTSFSDFLGQLLAVDGNTWTVGLTTTDSQGQSHPRQYKVTIDTQTTIVSISTVSGQVTPLTAADFHPGEVVSISGPGNLAGVTAFTATKISRLISS